jgi:hypothetical protein
MKIASSTQLLHLKLFEALAFKSVKFAVIVFPSQYRGPNHVYVVTVDGVWIDNEIYWILE